MNRSTARPSSAADGAGARRRRRHDSARRSSRIVPGLAALYAAAPLALLFVLALLQAQWTYTGYDASAHVAEETVMARLNSAWGIVPLGRRVRGRRLRDADGPDVVHPERRHRRHRRTIRIRCSTSSTTTSPPLFANVDRRHHRRARCGSAACASVTSMARMWYAFARDDGMPGSRC